MPDPTSAPSGASQDSPAPGQPAGSQPAGAAQPSGVDRAEFDAIKRALESRIEGQSGVLGKLQNQLEKLLKVADVAAPGAGEQKKPLENSELTLKVTELEKRLAEVQSLEQKVTRSAVRTSIESALRDRGVASAALVTDGLLARYGERLGAERDDAGNIRVTFRESESSIVPAPKWVEAWLETDEGRSVLPPRRNPSSSGLPGGWQGDNLPANRIRITRSQQMALIQSGRLKASEITPEKYDVVDG